MYTNLAVEQRRKPYSPNRSCERCRTLKVRCVPEDSTKCQRCTRLNVDCVYALPTKRKPRKRTDTKVAELEKEVRALSSILRNQQTANPHDASNSATRMEENHLESSSTGASGKNSASPEAVSSNSVSQTSARSPSEDPLDKFDAVKAGLLTEEMATKLFHIFRDQFLPSFPIIAFPPDITARQVRVITPVLYQAIIAAASSYLDPSLAPILNKRIMSAIAEMGMVRGVKSLDLLQALLVTTSWHYPETSFEHLKYHQYAHLAAGMASYVGIEKKSIAKAEKNMTQQPQTLPNVPNTANSSNDNDKDFDLINRQRTLLACYLLCSGVCRSLHRPTILPFTGWMAQCVKNIETSRFGADTDKTLASWVRLQRIMTDSATAFGLDDDDVFVDLSEPHVQRALAFYDLELKSWYENLPNSHRTASLDFLFHVSRVGLHEIALYLDHEQDDFHAPFSLDRIGRIPERKKEPTLAHIESFTICWFASIDALRAFSAAPVRMLQCSPFFFFVRMIYCVTVLIKLTQSATISPHKSSFTAANRETIIDLLSQLIIHMKAVGIGNMCPVASRVLVGLERMLAWLNRPKENALPDKLADDLLQPLMYLGLGNESGNASKSKDIYFDESKNKSTKTSDMTDFLAGEEVAEASQPTHESSQLVVDESSFMNWDEFEWNFVSQSAFDLSADLTLFDVDTLTFGSDAAQDFDFSYQA